MAIRFDAASDRISYSGSNPPDPASGFTILGWAMVVVDNNDNSTLARLHASSGGSTSANIATDSDGTTGPNYFTGGGSISSSTGLPVGQWRKWAATCTGTNGNLYASTVAGPTEADSGTVSGAATPTGITLGGRSSGDSSEWFNGRLAYVRLYSAVLSQSEIEAEWASATSVRTSNLWAHWPLTTASDLNDASGNGRHLVAGTTSVTTEDGPPISVPTKTGFMMFF